jgi:hypothetical protein
MVLVGGHNSTPPRRSKTSLRFSEAVVHEVGGRLQSAHPRRPSTITFAPKRTFASNALFFHDQSIRSAVTNT